MAATDTPDATNANTQALALEHVGSRELGEWLGLSARSVASLAERGVLTKAARGRYPLRASIAAYSNHMRAVAAGWKGQAGSGKDDEAPDLTTERALLARAQRERIEAEQARIRGDSIGRAELAAILTKAGAHLRSAAMNIPDRCAARICADLQLSLEQFGHAVWLGVRQEVTDYLDQVSKRLAAEAITGTPDAAPIDDPATDETPSTAPITPTNALEGCEL